MAIYMGLAVLHLSEFVVGQNHIAEPRILVQQRSTAGIYDCITTHLRCWVSIPYYDLQSTID